MVNQDDARLNQEMEPPGQDDSFQGAGTGPDPDSTTSPIRPPNPDPPRPRIAPSLTRPTSPRSSVDRSDDDAIITPDMVDLAPADKARLALDNLRDKMTAVVQEYADGLINQAQFNAIYRRYSEQREITERLLERNPESGAWQSVIQSGHTGFLREHFAAKILSYGLYRIDGGDQIILQGRLRLPAHQLKPILLKLKGMIAQGTVPKPARRKLKDGSWVLLVAGRYTASVVIFSLEPATIQRQNVEYAQRDFERANERLIRRGDFDPGHLVFPHRVLFE